MLTIACLCLFAAQTRPSLANASFEEALDAPGLAATWEECVIGARPAVTRDKESAQDGRYSLRIDAREATDAAMQQHVDVVPGAFYVVRGWVRIRDLVPDSRSNVYGTLAVMTPGGAGQGHKIAAGENHRGTTDWVRVHASFEAPPEGRVRVMCFLAGWGTATGTAWFDRIEIVSLEDAVLTLKVTARETVGTPASPRVCGNFIESGFGRQVDGLWAELLFNRSFEEVTPLKSSVWDWLGRRPSDDLSKEPWWHSGYEECPWYVAPGNAEASQGRARYWNFHHGLQSATLSNRSRDVPARLAQDGIWLRPGVALRFRGAVRHGEIGVRGAPIDVTVGVYKERDFGHPIAEARIAGVRNEWEEFVAELPNPEFEGRATFAVTAPPRVELSLDDFSLMPADASDGWRREAVAALLRVHPRVIRFPGGCYASFYNWRDGIGPRSERRPRESEYWGGLEPNDVGTAEFVQLCRKVGAEPFLCVNVMTGSAAEAAEWVAYANAGPGHPLGLLRLRHGFAEPFRVEYWELDNETYRKFGPLEYAIRCADFGRRMKAIDPSIRLVMVGYWRYRDALAEMLQIAGETIDLVTDRGMDEEYLRGVLDVIAAYNRKSGRDIRLCNTEWLAPMGDVPVIPDALNRQATSAEMTMQSRMIRWRYAMNAARQVLLFQRLGGDFVFSNFNNLANTWGQNVIECPKEGVYLSAAGRVFELMSRSPAAWILESRGAEHMPGVDAQVAWDIGRRALVIHTLNYHKTDVRASFDFSALGLQARTARVSFLTAASSAAFTTWQDRDAISRTDREEVTRDSACYETMLPALSVGQIIVEP